MDETKSTGERLLTGYFDRFSVEHIHRYAIAERFAAAKSVLDIACGEGYGSNLMSTAARHVVGVDIDPNVIKHAAEKYTRPNLTFSLGSVDKIPLCDASIDLVVSFETLEHHDKHEEMYREIKRVLRPSGILLISTPDKKHFSDETGHRNAYHVKELYREQFLSLNSRYFSNVAIYSQRFMMGSVVCSPQCTSPITFFSGDLVGVQFQAELNSPTYHICIASDSTLDQIDHSIFYSQPLLEKMEEKIFELEEEVEACKKRADALGQQHSDLLQSTSFRVGQALLSPLRRILGRT